MRDHMYVYYCRTYEKAVSGGGEREKGGLVLRDTTVTWLSDLFRRDSSRGGKFSRDSSCGPLLYAVLEPS